MPDTPTNYRELTRNVSAHLAGLRTSTPEVMKSFHELGRSATASGTLDSKTKELIALALSVAARCDPCGHHLHGWRVNAGVLRVAAHQPAKTTQASSSG